MKWIISRYNHDISYLPKYTEEYVMYDRSEEPIDDPRVIIVPNIGSDWYDKFTYIIDNYHNLPDVALYTKANIFKYITPEEFEPIKDNKTFTPLFTKTHEEKTVDMEQSRNYIKKVIESTQLDQDLKDLWYKLNVVDPTATGADIRPFAFYDGDGMYNELNVNYYMPLYSGREKKDLLLVKEIRETLGIMDMEYVKFAPGSNYIVPKENILKHPRSFYVRLRKYLVDALFIDKNHYPREAMLIERGMYTVWS
jgi:hypothetical protein